MFFYCFALIFVVALFGDWIKNTNTFAVSHQDPMFSKQHSKEEERWFCKYVAMIGQH